MGAYLFSKINVFISLSSSDDKEEQVEVITESPVYIPSNNE